MPSSSVCHLVHYPLTRALPLHTQPSGPPLPSSPPSPLVSLHSRLTPPRPLPIPPIALRASMAGMSCRHELPGMSCQASCHVGSSPMAALRALHMGSLRASTGAATPPPHEWALRLATSHASSARAGDSCGCPSLTHLLSADLLYNDPPLSPTHFLSLSPLLTLSPTLSSHQQYFLSHPRLLYLPPSSSCLSAAHAPYPPPISSACSSSPSHPCATPSPMCVGAAEGGRSHLPSHGSPFLRAARSDMLAQLLDGEVRGPGVCAWDGGRCVGWGMVRVVSGYRSRDRVGTRLWERLSLLAGEAGWQRRMGVRSGRNRQQPLLLRCHRPSHCPSPSERTTQDAACNLLQYNIV
ncbi:unnamed protein product [Closterium sp. Naga37s-1]|nr:unnamed protein product [Closterium sp. Naga37s-1]